MKKKPETTKAVLSGHFAGIAIFEVQFESQVETENPEEAWYSESLNVLDFDAQAAIDKTEQVVVVERQARMRLLGVRMLARAAI